MFSSDGNPNRRGGHTALGHSASIQTVTEANAMSWAIAEANAAKTAGTRILAVGIGNELDAGNLEDVSSADAVITSDFGQLADDLAALSTELCAGTITAHKVIDIDGNLATIGDQGDGPAWTFTTNVDAPDSSTPPSGNTDAAGLINFDVDLGANSVANVDVTETLKPGFTFLSAICTDQNDVPVGTPGALAVSDISITANDIISCTFYNRAPDCSHLDDQCNEGVWSFDTDQCEPQPIAGSCNDGLYCTTNDTCSAGACIGGYAASCSDGISCTVGHLQRGHRRVRPHGVRRGLRQWSFCDGAEVCNVATGCQAGTPVVCNDGVFCTADSCNEGDRSCMHAPNDASCSNGQFCDGIETCDQ